VQRVVQTLYPKPVVAYLCVSIKKQNLESRWITCELLSLGVPKKRIAQLLRVSRTTLYKYLRRMSEERQGN